MSGGASADDPTREFYQAIRIRRDALIAEVAVARAFHVDDPRASDVTAVITTKERAITYLDGFLQ